VLGAQVRDRDQVADAGAARPAIAWGSFYWQVANAYGYSVHNKNMLEQIRKHCELREDAPLALTIASADKFSPVPGKYNLLFTMFETPDLPGDYVAGIRRADELIVPCTWLEGVFRKYTQKPVSVCPEGTDPEKFPYVERAFPQGARRFRILWVGAPNMRKGYHYMVELARRLSSEPRFEVYIKTTVPNPPSPEEIQRLLEERGEEMIRAWGKERVEEAVRNALRRAGMAGPAGRLEAGGAHKNIILDTRDLPLAALRDLYHSAHLFVLPSLGEGFGLTLCEAMSTGLPCIAPAATGMRDFFDLEVGYPCRWKWQPHTLTSYNLRTHVVWPDMEHIVKLIAKVYSDYEEALKRGRRAAARIRERFTWDISGKRLAQTVQEAYGRLEGAWG
jgi:glycosyltransferase involved in cell wall biosynthesis